MSLESQLATLITAIGTDYKSIWAKIGSGTLNTSATNLIAAINEVKTTADSAGGTVPDASTTVKGISERATDAEALALSATDLTITPGNIGAITNVANGLLKLDGSAKVASTYLPAYVDDVLEYANLAAFPGTGATGIIYVAVDTNKTYRWSGSVYVNIAASPGTTDSLTEGSTNLYFTNARTDARITTLVGDTTIDLSALYTAAKV